MNVCIKMYIHQQRRNDYHNSIRFDLIYIEVEMKIKL